MLTKSSRSLTVLSISLSMGLAGVNSIPAIAYAPAPSATSASSPTALTHQRTSIAQRLNFNNQRIRPSRNRIGGIARGECGVTSSATHEGATGDTSVDSTANDNNSNTKPIALVPPSSAEISNRNQIEVESTLSERPTFFVYLPATTAQQAEFLLTTENPAEIIYEATFDVPDTDGVIGIKLPEDVPALETNHLYNWSLTVLCDPVDRSSNPFVEGWVERIEPSSFLAMRLEGAAVRDRPQIYSAAGIWQDTLSALAELRYANPTDAELTADWVSLLNSVNLEGIADAPLLTIENQTPPSAPAPLDESTSPQSPADTNPSQPSI